MFVGCDMRAIFVIFDPLVVSMIACLLSRVVLLCARIIPRCVCVLYDCLLAHLFVCLSD